MPRTGSRRPLSPHLLIPSHLTQPSPGTFCTTNQHQPPELSAARTDSALPARATGGPEPSGCPETWVTDHASRNQCQRNSYVAVKEASGVPGNPLLTLPRGSRADPLLPVLLATGFAGVWVRRAC